MTQHRPTVALWRPKISLRVRLAVLVAIVVSAVVGGAGYLETRLFEAGVLRDIVDTTRRTAQAIEDDIDLRPDTVDPDEIAETLHDFIEAVPSLREATVVRMQNGVPEPFASTASRFRPGVLALAGRALKSNGPVTANEEGPIRSYAAPIERNDRLFGAVVLTYSVSSVEQLRRRGRVIVVWFIPLAILGIAVVVDVLARLIIHRPLASVRRAMRSVGSGDLSARATVVRDDEIGEVARGLNEMLVRMEGFHDALQEKVREATEELRLRNRELVGSYERVLALREALARAERMAAMGQMAASVAHQVGTPLNLISGHVQMIREEEGPDSAVTRRLQVVAEQIEKVTAIVRTLLDHARRPSPRRPTDVATMLRRVVEIARPKLDALNVGLTLDAEAGLPAVPADEAQLELALLNLISNGVDAMPAGGTIALSVLASGPRVRIEVSDTGSGISPDLLPRLFEPWVTTKDPGKGTGLGLSITREVIEGHGGSISAANRPGSGAVFSIELPAADATTDGGS